MVEGAVIESGQLTLCRPLKRFGAAPFLKNPKISA
jgi:hypothetical protein